MFKLFTGIEGAKNSHTYIFTASSFVALHYYFTVYINSTFLNTFISQFWTGILYATSSVLTIYCLIRLRDLIAKYGLYRTLATITLFDLSALLLISQSNNVLIIIGSFIIYQSIPPLMLACLDTLIEDSTASNQMGKVRGFFLTILATASVISPLVIGNLVSQNGFKDIYLFSFFFISLFLIVITINKNKFTKGTFTSIKGLDSIREFFSDPDIRRIGIANLALHLFFSWMIIYIPVYLATEMGFTWIEIGTMISITLLPFMVLEIPTGELADKTLGEKEMLIGGIICMIIGTLLFPFLEANNFILWTLIILLARTGAAVAETMIESYFFKKIKGKDELIEVFRMAGPSAYIAGPLIGSIALLFIPFRFIFPILSIILFLTLIFTLKLKDTK